MTGRVYRAGRVAALTTENAMTATHTTPAQPTVTIDVATAMARVLERTDAISGLLYTADSRSYDRFICGTVLASLQACVALTQHAMGQLDTPTPTPAATPVPMPSAARITPPAAAPTAPPAPTFGRQDGESDGAWWMRMSAECGRRGLPTGGTLVNLAARLATPAVTAPKGAAPKAAPTAPKAATPAPAPTTGNPIPVGSTVEFTTAKGESVTLTVTAHIIGLVGAAGPFVPDAGRLPNGCKVGDVVDFTTNAGKTKTMPTCHAIVGRKTGTGSDYRLPVAKLRVVSTPTATPAAVTAPKAATPAPAAGKCQGTAKGGKPCGFRPAKGDTLCLHHKGQTPAPAAVTAAKAATPAPTPTAPTADPLGTVAIGGHTVNVRDAIIALTTLGYNVSR